MYSKQSSQWVQSKGETSLCSTWTMWIYSLVWSNTIKSSWLMDSKSDLWSKESMYLERMTRVIISISLKKVRSSASKKMGSPKMWSVNSPPQCTSAKLHSSTMWRELCQCVPANQQNFYVLREPHSIVSLVQSNTSSRKTTRMKRPSQSMAHSCQIRTVWISQIFHPIWTPSMRRSTKKRTSFLSPSYIATTDDIKHAKSLFVVPIFHLKFTYKIPLSHRMYIIT